MNRIFYIAAVAAIAACSSAQVVLNQVDTFTDGTTMFWSSGANPVNVPSGGPAGANDAYLQFTGLGGFGSGSVPAVNNFLQWTGNYTGAGVTIIRMDMRNFSAPALNMRLVFFGPGGSRWVTHPGFPLPGNSGWVKATYLITAANMTRVVGTETLAQTLGACSHLQIRNDTDPPSTGGEGAAATVGVDNISALNHLPSDAISFTVDTGFYFGGNVASLRLSDNDSLIVLNDETEPNGTLTVTSVRPTAAPVPLSNPSRIRIRLESAATRTDLSEFLRAFNYNTNQWVQISARIPQLVDTVVNSDITVNVSQYINSTDGQVRARVFWIPNSDIDAADGWIERVDEIEWQFYP